MSQTSKKSPDAFQASYAEAERTMKEILKRGCEEEITWWIRHIIKSIYAARKDDENLSFVNLTSLMDYCFRFQIRDSKLVVEVLEVVDLLADMLDLILGFAIHRPQTLSHDEIEKREQRGLQTFDYLSYILHHAYQRRETFNGRWFTGRPNKNHLDFLPVFSAVRYGSAQTVLTLLRYGFPITCGQTWGVDRSYLKNLRKEMPRMRRRSKNGDSQKSEENFCNVPNDLYNMLIMFCKIYEYSDLQKGDKEVDIPRFCEKFRIIWRAVSHPFITLNKCSESTCDVYECWEYFSKLRNDYIRSICSGHLQPRSLKHLCRYTVRRRLHQNWKLPYGIMDLNLPPVICKYLNLETD